MKTSPGPQPLLSILSNYLPALTGVCIVFAVTGCGGHDESIEITDAEVATGVVEPALDVTLDEAEELLAGDAGCVVLDVRTPEEYASGHIKGAVNIDFRAANFKEELGKLDREKPYLVHCGAGGRSASSLPMFEELGFVKVYHLAEGLGAWEAEGKPVEK